MKFSDTKGRSANSQAQSKADSFIEKGHGYISACGDSLKQDYKGWIEITDDISKGTKIHVLAYKKQFGLSVQLGKPKINTTTKEQK